VLYPPTLSRSLSLVSRLCCAYMPARASQRAVRQGWAWPKRHPRRKLPSSIIGGCNLARKTQKSQRGAFCISGLSFGAPLTDRLDPWL
jgi:hypothetical protein